MAFEQLQHHPLPRFCFQKWHFITIRNVGICSDCMPILTYILRLFAQKIWVVLSCPIIAVNLSKRDSWKFWIRHYPLYFKSSLTFLGLCSLVVWTERKWGQVISILKIFKYWTFKSSCMSSVLHYKVVLFSTCLSGMNVRADVILNTFGLAASINLNWKGLSLQHIHTLCVNVTHHFTGAGWYHLTALVRMNYIINLIQLFQIFRITFILLW